MKEFKKQVRIRYVCPRHIKNFKKLIDLAARLRSRNGCPWDKKQTISSMLERFLEEAREVKSAMKKRDYKNLKEELGDLIFTMIMIAQIAREKKLFTINEVLRDINKKIRRRHTWVFGKHKARSAKHALEMWRANKKREHAIHPRRTNLQKRRHKN